MARDLGVYADELSEAQLAATSAAIAEAVQKQLDLSIRPITSGEYERTDFFSGFFEKLKACTSTIILPHLKISTLLCLLLELLRSLGQAYCLSLPPRLDLVDDLHLTYSVLDTFKDGLRHNGVDPDELLDLYIWAHNEAIKNRLADLYLGVHLCRGNMPGTKGFLNGSYESIAERILTGLNYETF
ncbi:hypothetical protein QQZ08_003607 [Neonectria magnoliae]|uniref:Uncharacterized protein n=1 Tax=Neonectria magnoliae TaxID=2732573 RepID=A0ABR1I867_9HYPO